MVYTYPKDNFLDHIDRLIIKPKFMIKKIKSVFIIFILFLSILSLAIPSITITVSGTEWSNAKMHYPQYPDSDGWDVAWNSTTLADDWMCNETGYVTGIHLWVSSENDSATREDIEYSFGENMIALNIYNNNVSLWSLDPESMTCTITAAGPFYGDEGWFVPPDNYSEHNHQLFWRVDITNISDPFYQEEGTIYWLVVAIPEDYDIGWKTSQDHFMDNAVYSYEYWSPLYDPINETDPIDFAFVITGEQAEQVPTIITNNSIDIGETNATLCGYLDDDGGEPCYTSFEYGETTSYGNTIETGFNYNWSIVNNEGDGDVEDPSLMAGTSNNHGYISSSAEFHPELNFTISSVSVHLTTTGSPYALLVDIYIDNNPCDTSWTDGTKVKDDWSPSWSSGWQTITLDTPYEVVAGQTYEISFASQNLGSDNAYVFMYLDTSPDSTYYRWQHNEYYSATSYADIIFYGITYDRKLNSGEEFNATISSLGSGTLYHYRAVAQNSNSTSYGTDTTFLTKPFEPTNLTATVYSSFQINLTWTKGNGTNNTYIEHNTISSWNLGEGVEIYNGTGTNYEDTGLTPGTTYYYQAWSYCNEGGLYQHSDGFDSTYNTTTSPPTVTTNDATNMGTTTVTLNGNLIGNGTENCTVRFEYGKTTSYGNNTDQMDMATTGEFEYVINGSGSFADGSGNSLSVEDISYGVQVKKQGYFSTLRVVAYGGSSSNHVICNVKDGSNNVLVSKDLPVPIESNAHLLTFNFAPTDYSRLLEAGETVTVTMDSNYVTYRIADDVDPQSRENNYCYIASTRNIPIQRSPVTGFDFLVFNESLYCGALYHYRAVANNTIGTGYGLDKTFLTKPDTPTSAVATTYNATQINISWTKGIGADNTYIERNTVPSWSRGEGTVVYNGTEEHYNDSGLFHTRTYYYQLWSYVESDSLYQYSDSSITTINTTETASPITETNDATNVGTTTATLNGNLIDGTGETCTVWFEYGKTTSYGYTTSNQSKQTGEEFNDGITSLDPGTLYHYRAVAQNSNSTSYGTDTTFLTKPLEPTNLTATVYSSSQINLTWTKGNGTNNTYIIRKTTSYPSNRSDGSIIYNGTGTSYSDTSLSASTTYYYRLWSYSEWNSLNQWSNDYKDISSTTAQNGEGGPSLPPLPPPPHEETLTTKEQVENLFDITLVKDFYATDEDGDGIFDSFNDPNGILENLHFVNITGNASFLISVYGNEDLLFIWDTESSDIIEVDHTAGIVNNTVFENNTRTMIVTVNVNKTGWIYLEIEDDYKNYQDLVVETSDGRIIAENMIWRDNKRIIVLDDPALEYIFTFTKKSKNFLFDVVLELTSDSLFIGESINALITLINVGDLGLVNATLNYTLYKDDNIIWYEEENLSISGQLAFNKTISTLGLSAGEYTLEVVHYYGDNQNASAHATFTIKSQENAIKKDDQFLTYAILILVIIGLILFLFWYVKIKGSGSKVENFEKIEKEIDEKLQNLNLEK
jgi:hypothetical protein